MLSKFLAAFTMLSIASAGGGVVMTARGHAGIGVCLFIPLLLIILFHLVLACIVLYYMAKRPTHSVEIALPGDEVVVVGDGEVIPHSATGYIREFSKGLYLITDTKDGEYGWAGWLVRDEFDLTQ